jgi:hypothetical protein
MKLKLRFGAALAGGCVTALAIALTATLAARTLWPAYAAAEPRKAYTLVMLVVRLAVGASCAAGSAGVATIIARDTGRAAWWLGGFLLAISLPMHLYYEWADFPVWYHLLYLFYLMPIAGLTGRAVGSSPTRSSPAFDSRA